MYTHNPEQAEYFAQAHTQEFVSGLEEGIKSYEQGLNLKPESFDKNLAIYNMQALTRRNGLTADEIESKRAFYIGMSVGYEVEFLREKTSTGSALAESGFTPEGVIGKTVGLSYGEEANL